MLRERADHPTGAALVVGGGIAGMQASLDLVGAGVKVYLVDRKPAIGGVMSQLDKTFPTNDCAMCTMAPRLVEVGRQRDIEVLTLSDVERVEGVAGRFTVTIRTRPRFVDEDRCTGCGSCVSSCPTRNTVQLVPVSPVALEPRYAKVAGIVARHLTGTAPLLPILQEVNAVFSWLPENALQYIAQETGYSLAHVYRLATFYSAFRLAPPGLHVIQVCMGTSCYVNGSQPLVDRLSELLAIEPEETTSDKKFTLRLVRCIGCCGLAPALMVDRDVHGKLARKDIDRVMERYRKAG